MLETTTAREIVAAKTPELRRELFDARSREIDTPLLLREIVEMENRGYQFEAADGAVEVRGTAAQYTSEGSGRLDSRTPLPQALSTRGASAGYFSSSTTS